MNTPSNNQNFLKNKKKKVESNLSDDSFERERGANLNTNVQNFSAKKQQNDNNNSNFNNKNNNFRAKQNFQKIGNDNKTNNINNNMNNNNRKRLICNYYINGACHKGNECTFSHDTPQVKKPNVNFYYLILKELCKFFLTGNCHKGEECLYSHNTLTCPCKYFHSIGFCEKGTECK